MEAEDSIFDFPCEFPIKAMGKAGLEFDCLVVALIRKHCPDIAEAAVQTRLSKGGNYMSVTVTIQAQNRAQLDSIYHELSSDSRVLFAL
jgi:uncharacterized protein